MTRIFTTLKTISPSVLKSSRLQRRWNLRNKRKHTQTSIILSILIGGVIFISSCTGKKWNYDFQTSEEALSLYRQELKAVRDMPSCTTDEFITALQDWQEMSDTVFAYIEKDPAFTAHAGLSMDFMALSDSIRMEFYRIATKGNYSLADIAKIKLATSSFDASQQMIAVQQEALKLYAKADSVSLDKNIKGERLLSLYRNYLTRTKRSGIHSESEMLAFIIQEDKLFRGYLAELPLFIQSKLTDITQLTDEICQGIYSAANKGRIGKESVLVYMGMRTNRRLLQNACASEQIIASGKARNAPQVEKPGSFDPRGQVALTPRGKIRETPCGKIKMTPEDNAFSGAFFVVLHPVLAGEETVKTTFQSLVSR